MGLKVRKEPLDVILSASLFETELDDLVRCSASKFVPPRPLSWYNGHVYCLVYRWAERPAPRIHVFEVCRAPLAEFRSYLEIRVPTLVTVPVVRAKGLDLSVIKKILEK